MDAGRPIDEADIVDAIYNVIFATELHYEDCKKWDEKPAVDKTWTNLQTHFTKAQTRYQKRQKATTKQMGFHSANAVVTEELERANEVLVNMATASARDKEEMTQLHQIIASQQTMITTLTKNVAELTNGLTEIKTKIDALKFA